MSEGRPEDVPGDSPMLASAIPNVHLPVTEPSPEDIMANPDLESVEFVNSPSNVALHEVISDENHENDSSVPIVMDADYSEHNESAEMGIVEDSNEVLEVPSEESSIVALEDDPVEPPVQMRTLSPVPMHTHVQAQVEAEVEEEGGEGEGGEGEIESAAPVLVQDADRQAALIRNAGADEGQLSLDHLSNVRVTSEPLVESQETHTPYTEDNSIRDMDEVSGESSQMSAEANSNPNAGIGSRFSSSSSTEDENIGYVIEQNSGLAESVVEGEVSDIETPIEQELANLRESDSVQNTDLPASLSSLSDSLAPQQLSPSHSPKSDSMSSLDHDVLEAVRVEEVPVSVQSSAEKRDTQNAQSSDMIDHQIVNEAYDEKQNISDELETPVVTSFDAHNQPNDMDVVKMEDRQNEMRGPQPTLVSELSVSAESSSNAIEEQMSDSKDEGAVKMEDKLVETLFSSDVMTDQNHQFVNSVTAYTTSAEMKEAFAPVPSIMDDIKEIAENTVKAEMTEDQEADAVQMESSITKVEQTLLSRKSSSDAIASTRIKSSKSATSKETKTVESAFMPIDTHAYSTDDTSVPQSIEPDQQVVLKATVLNDKVKEEVSLESSVTSSPPKVSKTDRRDSSSSQTGLASSESITSTAALVIPTSVPPAAQAAANAAGGPGCTRCPCLDNENEDGFMIQCELCDVWQHGLCIGINSENEAPSEYYCELCLPEWEVHRRRREHAANGAFYTRPAKARRARGERGKKSSAGAGAGGRGKGAKSTSTAADEDEEATEENGEKRRSPIDAGDSMNAITESPDAEEVSAVATSATGSSSNSNLSAQQSSSMDRDLLSIDDSQLTREERSLKRVMETFLRLEERQRRSIQVQQQKSAAAAAGMASGSSFGSGTSFSGKDLQAGSGASFGADSGPMEGEDPRAARLRQRERQRLLEEHQARIAQAQLLEDQPPRPSTPPPLGSAVSPHPTEWVMRSLKPRGEMYLGRKSYLLRATMSSAGPFDPAVVEPQFLNQGNWAKRLAIMYEAENGVTKRVPVRVGSVSSNQN